MSLGSRNNEHLMLAKAEVLRRVQLVTVVRLNSASRTTTRVLRDDDAVSPYRNWLPTPVQIHRPRVPQFSVAIVSHPCERERADGPPGVHRVVREGGRRQPGPSELGYSAPMMGWSCVRRTVEPHSNRSQGRLISVNSSQGSVVRSIEMFYFPGAPSWSCGKRWCLDSLPNMRKKASSHPVAAR